MIAVLRPRLLVPVALLVLVGAGCTLPSNTPDTYDARTEANYINGCLAVNDPDDENLYRAATVEDRNTTESDDDVVVVSDDVPEGELAVCQCQYDAMSEVTGETNSGEPEYALPFDQFEDINDDLSSNLPESADDTDEDGGDEGDNSDTTTTTLSPRVAELVDSCLS